MKEFRMDRNTKEHYYSFQEAAHAWGCKTKTKDENKIKEMQDKFCAKYRCSVCGEPMGYIGGTIMTCVNDKCKGVKVEREDKEGNKTVSYEVSYKFIKDYDISYANYIFS